MTYDRKPKRGVFKFEGSKIDLTQWDIPTMEADFDDARNELESAMESAVAQAVVDFQDTIGTVEERIREYASEAMRIAIEEDITVGFWQLSEPEMMTIDFPSLSNSDFRIELDFRKSISELLLDCCDEKDGYVQDRYEEGITRFAKMLDDISTELKAAIRPKEDK